MHGETVKNHLLTIHYHLTLSCSGMQSGRLGELRVLWIGCIWLFVDL